MAIKDVCEELGLSPYVFRKLFLRNVGLTPKRYLRIERFRTTINRLTPAASLSDLAFDALFSDQSHMRGRTFFIDDAWPPACEHSTLCGARVGSGSLVFVQDVLRSAQLSFVIR
ncbi:helix-turn-helix domain-containing protein [Chelativorans sp. YIM 93263]|uniref:helix-turn-helix domain-containing protein n=1 Tax=Chelativorans sp. YIM 93263 TaxID=2906648 RepID=UPI00403DB24B